MLIVPYSAWNGTQRHKMALGTCIHRQRRFAKHTQPCPMCERYATGMLQPNYPVPAVKLHYDWGWDLIKDVPALMVFEYGRF